MQIRLVDRLSFLTHRYVIFSVDRSPVAGIGCFHQHRHCRHDGIIGGHRPDSQRHPQDPGYSVSETRICLYGVRLVRKGLRFAGRLLRGVGLYGGAVLCGYVDLVHREEERLFTVRGG